MMTITISRPAGKSWFMALNMIGLTIVGILSIQDGTHRIPPSPFLTTVGSVFLTWAAWIAFNLPRGLIIRLDDRGIFAKGIVGTHRFGWDDLIWADFTRPAASGLLCYAVGGKEGLVVLSPKTTTGTQRDEVLAEVRARRPDLPLTSPKPL
jgi:hypothetical protein